MGKEEEKRKKEDEGRKGFTYEEDEKERGSPSCSLDGRVRATK